MGLLAGKQQLQQRQQQQQQASFTAGAHGPVAQHAQSVATMAGFMISYYRLHRGRLDRPYRGMAWRG